MLIRYKLESNGLSMRGWLLIGSTYIFSTFTVTDIMLFANVYNCMRAGPGDHNDMQRVSCGQDSETSLKIPKPRIFYPIQ